MGDENKILTVQNLTVDYTTFRGNVHAVRGVSFEVNRGETLALVGESGCGKSASVKPIIGEDASNQVIKGGKIIYRWQHQGKLEEIDLLKITAKEMQRKIKGRQIAMVFQDPMTSLDPTMRIGKQIGEAVASAHSKLSKKKIDERVRNLIATVGINRVETVAKQYPHQLSGGMRQRIVIAIALAGDPQLLICDEPTTALDVTIQARILDIIKKIQKERHLSVIFITHNLGVVATIADKVNVMYAGKVIEKGTIEDIFFEPKHPYTWGLLESVPDVDAPQEALPMIAGTIPDMTQRIIGDAFAPRNEYALDIDFVKEPPMFEVSKTHQAATWLLDKRAPTVQMPRSLQKRINRMQGENNGK
ncbi:ABC transporter ATP-binding protein [Pediococcus siamensis]|uniref:ABC transporter ATP-binding protein n=1 Tax=Pediococcus siamensis TaxID=381829 RepID=UPI00399EF358